MKKFLSIILSAVMVLTMTPMAFAADNPMGDTLSTVTQKVKSQLNIGNEYTNFRGTAQDDGLNEYWNLAWEKKDGSRLLIDATPSGKIMSYDLFLPSENPRYYWGDFAPAFPTMTIDTAKEIAGKFLDKVLDKSQENYEFLDNNWDLQAQNTTDYYLNGTIKLKGLTSPIRFNIKVGIAGKAVTNFSRTDRNSKFLNGVPSSKATVSKDEAAKLLKSIVQMKLEYTTNTGNPEDKNNDKAVLRYFPIYKGDYIVDAQSGKLINMEDAYKEAEETGYDKGGMGSATENARADSKLSQAELDGIDKLTDVLSKDKLDSKVRAMSELGLSDFTLADTYYSRNDKDEYFCNLTYAKSDINKQITRKYAYVNAKTGELISLDTSYPSDENTEKGPLDKAKTQKKAEEFLAKYFKINFAKTKQYTQSDDTSSTVENNRDENFVYAQQENGYFFPENAYYLSISKRNGTVDNFSGNFRDVSFDSAEGIITMDQAVSTYYNVFTTALAYVSYPKQLDLSAPEYQPYISRGYRYLYELKLAYTAQKDPAPYAIDAKTGKPLYYDTTEPKTIAYSDVKSGKEILELAKYGIGYTGGSFQRSKKLTQLDMVALLVSANGYLYTPSSDTAAVDQLYEYAYNLGILQRKQRSDNKNITRAELVKTILSMSGYGKTAELPGIYICSFKDHKSIPAQYYGYVAIAQGLGMIKGDSRGNFSPNAIATREQAAIMLYNFMKRS